MRIAINALPVGPGMTGIGAYAVEVLKAAARLTDEHEFCVLRRPGAGDDRLFAFAEAWPAPNPTPLWEQTQLPGELAARGIGLYHSPLFTCPVVEEAPAAITLHDAVPEAMPETCSPEFLAFHRANAPRSLRAARFVVTTSESAKAEIVERMGADESAVRSSIRGTVVPQSRRRGTAGLHLTGEGARRSILLDGRGPFDRLRVCDARHSIWGGWRFASTG